MTKQHFFSIKLGIFLFGLAIIFISYMMFATPWEKMSQEELYFWGNLALVYLIFMGISLFLHIRAGKFEQNIFPLFATWASDALFAIFCLLLVVCVMKGIMIAKVAILVQFILLFIFSIIIYIALFTGTHIERVAKKDEAMTEYVGRIKRRAGLIQSELKKETACERDLYKLMDSFLYLSPTANEEACELEKKIVAKLNELQTSLDNNESEESEAIAQELTKLYKMRKGIVE